MTVVAFFDLDRTLLRVNSGVLWVDRERRHGRINWKQAVDAGAHILLYHFGFGDMEMAVGRALAYYRGESEARLADWTREWFDAEVAHRFAPGGLRQLEWHRRAGHALVLLTSSSRYVSEIVADQLKLDGWLCQGYQVRDGILTGEPTRPLCYGPGKVVYAERYAAERGADLRSCYFYSDSYTDLPMLERVGEPRVVNPDLRLRLTARRRGWAILDWSR